MTFAELKGAVKDYCNLTSTEADTRIGKAINRHYRRVTSLLGLDAARFVTRSTSMTVGVRTVTFSEIEKIDRIIDTTTSTAIRPLQEVSLHDIRTTQPADGQPTAWALQNTDADSVTVIFDTVPQSAYSLQADGTTTLADLTGTDEPVFPESFHDILVWYVLSEELLKKEKDTLADKYEEKAERLLSDLRFHLAESPTRDTVQGASIAASSTPGSSGGTGTVGGTNYTQTGLITFDLDPAAPFAVTANSAVVTNLDADKLDGFDWASAMTFTGIANTGLKVLDTDASHALSIVPGSNLTAARTLTLTTGDAARTVTLSGNPTLADWFDQSVKVAATPTFGATTLSGALTMSAGQIIFPAAQNAAAGANTLDDYEEGTWTPAIAFGGGSTGLTYTSRGGWYIKIGQLVVVGGSFTLSAKGSSTGNAAVTGLPFTSMNTASLASAVFFSRALNLTTITRLDGTISINSTQIDLSGNGTVATQAHFNDTTSVDGFVGAYRATA